MEVHDTAAACASVTPTRGRGPWARRADRRRAGDAARVDPGPAGQDGVGRRSRRLARLTPGTRLIRGPAATPGPVASRRAHRPAPRGRRTPRRRRHRRRGHPAGGPGHDGPGRALGDRHRRARGRAGGHRHRQVAGLPRARDPPRRREGHHGRRLHGHDRAAAPARRPRPPPAGQGAQAAARPRPDVRHPQGPPQLPVPQQAARRRREPRGRAVRPVPDLRDGPGGQADPRVGRRHRDRRPRRARPRRARQHVAAGVGHRPRVPRRGQVPRRRGVLRRDAPARRPGGRTSSSPTTRCSPSTPWRGGRCCPSTTWWWSTRRTSWSTGSPASPPPS